MKKLLLLFLLSFIVIFSFAQFPNPQTIGSPTTLWDQQGAARAKKGLINGSYTDTTQANVGNIDFYPAAQIFTTSDDQIWVRDATATRWINVTTGFTPIPTCGLQSGTGIVTWDSLLVFDISPAIYSLCCDSIPRSTVQDSILLPAADPSNPVYVAIILDANGVNYVRGVPAANPSLPQLTDCQIALTYVLINAGDVVPANVSVTTIYDENYTTEWDSVTTSTLVMDTANTTFPVHLLKDIDVTSYGTGGYMTFRTATTVDLNNYGILKFYVRLKGVATIRFLLTWYLDGVQQTFSAVPLVISGITGVYQVMAVPISAFRILNTSSVNTLRIQVFGTQGFYLDWIQLQAGIIPSSPIDNGFTTLNVGNLDSLFNSFVTFPIGQPVVNYTKQNVPAYTALVNPNNTSGPFVWTKINLATPIITGLLPVTNIAPGNANDILTTIGGVATWVPSTGGYDTTFVVNGLHVIPGVTSDTLSLGGSLRENVTIATVASTLTISTATSTVNPLAVTSTTGNAIISTATAGDAIQGFTTSGSGGSFVSVSGVGVAAQSTSNLAASYTVIPSSTNTIVPVLQVNRASSGTAANGIGASIDFVNQKITTGGSLSNRIISKWSNAVAANATSQLIFTGINLGSPDTLMRLSGNGLATLNQYGSGTFTGTAAYTLQVDASGNIIEGSAAGGGGTALANFYLKDSTLSGNRTVSMGTNSLTFSEGGPKLLFIDPANGIVKIGDIDALNNYAFISMDGIAQTITLTAASGNVIMQQSSGNVGIGTATPTSTNKLEIQATGSDNGTWSQTVDGFGVYGYATGTGLGVQGVSVDGTGVRGLSTNSVAVLGISQNSTAGTFVINTAGTNTVERVIDLWRTSSGGAGANGIGESVDFLINTSTSNTQISNQLISKWTDATQASRTSQFIITGVDNTSTKDLATFSSNAGLVLNGSLALPYTAQTGTYQILATDYTINCTSGTFTVTLPTAVGITGRIYTIKNSGAGVITVATTSSQTIDGVTTQTLSVQYSSYTVQSNGANWIIL